MRASRPDHLYYFKLQREARSFRVDLARKQWCDHWHTHFDWDGFGNMGWAHRRRHLNALLVALGRARRELATCGMPCQLFATVHPRSSTDDAVYVHTENPNGSPFPLDFGYATPLSVLPPLLSGKVSSNHYSVLKAGDPDDPYFIILASHS